MRASAQGIAEEESDVSRLLEIRSPKYCQILEYLDARNSQL